MPSGNVPEHEGEQADCATAADTAAHAAAAASLKKTERPLMKNVDFGYCVDFLRSPHKKQYICVRVPPIFYVRFTEYRYYRIIRRDCGREGSLSLSFLKI